MWFMNEEREMLQNMARDFAETEVKPFINEMEENCTFPHEIMKKAAECGITGLILPEDCEGSGPSWVDFGICLEEISKESCVVGNCLASQYAGTSLLTMLGREDVTEKVLKPICRGEFIMATSQCEPAGQTRLNDHKSHFEIDPDTNEIVLNASKIFTTNAGEAEWYLVCAKAPEGMGGKFGYILVHKDTPGVICAHVEHKIGWNGSSTGSMIYNNVRVPMDNLMLVMDIDEETTYYKSEGGYHVKNRRENSICNADAQSPPGGGIFQSVQRMLADCRAGRIDHIITKRLNESGYVTQNDCAFHKSAVERILRNYTYTGNLLLQTKFRENHLTKVTRKNHGELPRYHAVGTHEAIISPETFNAVQMEIQRRKEKYAPGKPQKTSLFSGRITCADCGEIFGAKTWHSTDRYRRVVWQCNGKFKGEHKCETPHLTEERLKELFLAALGAYLSDRNAAIDQLRCAQRTLTDTDFIDADIQALEEELTGVTGMLRLCIEENAANTTTEEAYRTAHADLCRRFEETEAKLAALQRQREKMKADAVAIGGMMFELGELTALPLTFDEKLWNGTVDHVTVHADERVVFRFKDGKEITTRL